MAAAPKKHKKLKRDRVVIKTLWGGNHVWSIDFASDQLSCGRCFMALNIVDDYSRELVGQLMGFSITGARAARFLDRLGETRGLPDAIVCDNGPEPAGEAMFFWSERGAPG